MKTPEALLEAYLDKSGITSEQYIAEDAAPHFLAGYYAAFTNVGAEAMNALAQYQKGRKPAEKQPMKISKLSEHIGHGTHMFHVTVNMHFDTGIGAMEETELYLVAANNERHAIEQAVVTALSLTQGEGLGSLNALAVIEASRAYEIGEIEP